MSFNEMLYKDLPTKINVNDKIYDINYDYKTILKIMIALEDDNLYKEEKAYIMIKLLYKEDISEEDIPEAIKKAILFIDLGKDEEDESEEKERIYSFTKDGNYILTGINSTHHIDISEHSDMHWWKFMALFMDMNTECFFSELIYYRKRKLEGKLTKEEKDQYKKIKNLVDLEQYTKEVQKQKEARRNFLEEFYN
ncbi:MAG TPA: hypothetical protein DCE23_04440 [Firmicutes bacterium]|nr:hypothetical protein [Bacillota bacterium]